MRRRHDEEYNMKGNYPSRGEDYRGRERDRSNRYYGNSNSNDDRRELESDGRRHRTSIRAKRSRSRSESRSRSRYEHRAWDRNRSKSPSPNSRSKPDRNQKERNYRDLDRPGKQAQELTKAAKVEEEGVKNEQITVELAVKQAAAAIEEGDEDAQLAAFLGITSFSSTKGHQVKGNKNNSATNTTKKHREYRQYLFVKGAYDIPLTQEHLEAAKGTADEGKKKHHYRL